MRSSYALGGPYNVNDIRPHSVAVGVVNIGYHAIGGDTSRHRFDLC